MTPQHVNALIFNLDQTVGAGQRDYCGGGKVRQTDQTGESHHR